MLFRVLLLFLRELLLAHHLLIVLLFHQDVLIEDLHVVLHLLNEGDLIVDPWGVDHLLQVPTLLGLAGDHGCKERFEVLRDLKLVLLGKGLPGAPKLVHLICAYEPVVWVTQVCSTEGRAPKEHAEEDNSKCKNIS